MTEHRTVEKRTQDVKAALEAQGQMFLATADVSAGAHLIAVSPYWDGQDLVVATAGSSRTAANLRAGATVRLAGGTPSDAIMIAARVVEVVSAATASAQVAEGFHKAMGWDPREMAEPWVFARLQPTRIQAYRGYDELEGRDVMRKSKWLA